MFLLILIIAIVFVVLAKQKEEKKIIEVEKFSVKKEEVSLPMILDLGADKCRACKAMVPVLDSLEKGFKGKLKVKFIDIWKNPKEAEKYKIKTIPTQIFFDKKGEELYRHIGFISENDILDKFKSFDIKLEK